MEKEREQESKGQEPQLYEVGYHIIPTIEEENLPNEVAHIRDAVESLGGIIVQDEMPQLRELAYPLSKIFSNKRSEFTSAYFGFMTFTMSPESAPLLKEKIDGLSSLVRYIIIKTEEEVASEKVSHKMTFLSGSHEKKKKTISSQEKISEEELDKTIDELVRE
ncbi:MAG: 30S ribosomal protein S6 [Candidatus Paceibacterota bacterium]